MSSMMNSQMLQTIEPKPWRGRARLATRLVRFAFRSTVSGDFDFVISAAVGMARLVGYSLEDLTVRRRAVQCNLCGWMGNRFYPNVGPGYHETNSVCPGCQCQDRHRSLVSVLSNTTHFFQSSTLVVEVAPMRRFQEFTILNKTAGYVSIDYERYAMERGDITAMRFQDNSQDYLLALHVLEHVNDESRALDEIHRILKPGGTAILQVPIDSSVPKTYEYERPNPREVGHVRRYGQDFPRRVSAHGFDVKYVASGDVMDNELCRHFGLCPEPFLFATKSPG